MIRKKIFMMIVFIISCSIYAVAQTDYYYCKGKKIPLTINEDKVCVSIPKNSNKNNERIPTNVKILERTGDDTFDFFVILRSEFEKLTSYDSWKENAKSAIITPSYFTTEKKEVYLSPYLSVKLKNVQDTNILTSYAERHGLKIVKQDLFMPLWYILSITQGSEKNTLKCANEMYESGMFAETVPDLCADKIKCSNDPLFTQQWGLHNNQNPGIDISVSSAWNYATGKNIKIAVLDDGVDLNHTDLASNICNLSYDLETSTSPSKLYGTHGTQCAGIAAAIKDNGIQIAGVAPEATIVSISDSMIISLCTPNKLAEGINWAYLHGVDIISNSWYYPSHHPIIEDAIQNAFLYGRQGKGCVIVFAAGNDGYYSNESGISYPANCNDTILVVGSIDSTGMRATDSKYGPELDVVAPGVNILSTFPNDSTGYDEGTSMACPHVAGIAALILERNSELTVSQVNSIICSSAKKLSGVNFDVIKPDGSWNNEIGYGLVDAYNAVINTPNTVYIQNETITGTRIISAENIYVGRDVTNTKPYGDVVLGQGDITIKADYIEIKNSTTVPLGTALTIEN